VQSLGHTTQGFFFAMASLRHTFEQPFGAGSLVLSLALHVALVVLVLMAGWQRPSATSTILEVSLVAPLPGDSSAAPGKPASGGLTQAQPAPAVKPVLKSQIAVKTAKNPLPPPGKKRRKRLAALPPSSPVKAEAVAPQPQPAASPVPTYAALPTRASGSDSEGKVTPGGSRDGGASNTAGSASGLGRGSGRGHGNQGSGSGGLVAAQSQYLGLIRARILAHRHYPPIARARHMEGVVHLRFTLSNSGTLNRGVQIVKPSGFSVLDQQASQCVLAAAPFPPFPPELRRNSLTVEVPIVYRLKDFSS
jgi:protein TonB